MGWIMMCVAIVSVAMMYFANEKLKIKSQSNCNVSEVKK